MDPPPPDLIDWGGFDLYSSKSPPCLSEVVPKEPATAMLHHHIVTTYPSVPARRCSGRCQQLRHSSADASQPAQSSAPHVEMVQPGGAPAAASEEAMQLQSCDNAQRSAQQQSAQQQSAQELPGTRAALEPQMPSTTHAAQLKAVSSRAVTAEEVQRSAAEQPKQILAVSGQRRQQVQALPKK
ncbi:hypothetical protein ABBQ38_014850 [Trebouxia sp. C0009 RCD-2024]